MFLCDYLLQSYISKLIAVKVLKIYINFIKISINFIKISIEWDEVALHRQEDGGIDPENEIATEIDGEDVPEIEDGGTSERYLV